MAVLKTERDNDELTLTVVSEFDASVERVWRVWEDPHRLEFDDGFAGEDGEPSGFLGVTHGIVTIEAHGPKTRMTVVSRCDDLEQLEKLTAMGMEEGLRQAIGQIDDLLADGSRA
jgi:uncharacterized protein YndB with AHSA1/START domain